MQTLCNTIFKNDITSTYIVVFGPGKGNAKAIELSRAYGCVPLNQILHKPHKQQLAAANYQQLSLHTLYTVLIISIKFHLATFCYAEDAARYIVAAIRVRYLHCKRMAHFFHGNANVDFRQE